MCEYCEQGYSITPIAEGNGIYIVPPDYEPAKIVLDNEELDTYMFNINFPTDSNQYWGNFGDAYYKIFFCSMCGREL